MEKLCSVFVLAALCSTLRGGGWAPLTAPSTGQHGRSLGRGSPRRRAARRTAIQRDARSVDRRPARRSSSRRGARPSATRSYSRKLPGGKLALYGLSTVSRAGARATRRLGGTAKTASTDTGDVQAATALKDGTPLFSQDGTGRPSTSSRAPQAGRTQRLPTLLRLRRVTCVRLQGSCTDRPLVERDRSRRLPLSSASLSPGRSTRSRSVRPVIAR